MTCPPSTPRYEHRSLSWRAVLATAAVAAVFPAALVAVAAPRVTAVIVLAGLAVTRLARTLAGRLRGYTRVSVAGFDVELAVRRTR